MVLQNTFKFRVIVMGINTLMNTDGKPFSVAATNNNGNRHKSIKLSETLFYSCAADTFVNNLRSLALDSG